MYTPLLPPSSQDIMLAENFKSVWGSSKSRNGYLCGCTKAAAHVWAPLTGEQANVCEVSESTQAQCSPVTISLALL